MYNIFDLSNKIKIYLKMIHFNDNVTRTDLNSIFEKLSYEDILQIVFYFCIKSPRREWFQKFFTNFDKSKPFNDSDPDQNAVTMYIEVTHIFHVFSFAYHIIYDMTPLQLFTFIDEHFDYGWLAILADVSKFDCGPETYAIAFVAAKHGFLDYLDFNSIYTNEFEDEYNKALLDLEYTDEKINELNSYIIEYENAYNEDDS